jgi:hypothetical protein
MIFSQIPCQVRRQLEYTIAASKGVTLIKPPRTLEVVRELFKTNGVRGLYTGGRLHFGKYRSLCEFLSTCLSRRLSSGHIWDCSLFFRVRCYAPFTWTQAFRRAGSDSSVATHTCFFGTFCLRILSWCIIMGHYLSS